MTAKQIVLTINIFFLSVAQLLLAGDTNFLPIFGARTLARNGLYFAGSDGLASAVANPAALLYTEGRLLQLVAMDRAGRQQLDSPGAGLFRSFRYNDFAFAGGAFWRVSDGLAAGISYHRAADFRVEWPFAIFREKPGSSVVLVFEMLNQLTVDAITPTAAFKLGGMAFGISVNVYRVTQHTAFPLANDAWYQGIGLSAYQFDYDQDAWTFGVNVGLSADLSKKLQVGGTARMGYSADLEGQAVSNMFVDLNAAPAQVALSSKFKMPWIFGAGLLYKLGERSELNLDAAYNLWGSTQDQFRFTFSDAAWQNGLASADTVTGFQGDRFPLNFDNALDVGIGYEYTHSAEWNYRASYRFSQSPNSAATYSLLLPGVHQHWFTAGIGYQSGRFTLDGALAFAIGQSREVASQSSGIKSGKYTSNVILPVASLRYRL